MNIPKNGDKYLYASQSYPMINNLLVEIKQAKNNFIRLKVLDEEFLNNQLQEAKNINENFKIGKIL